MENISFVVVIVGGDNIEVYQYWEAPAPKLCEYVADAVVAFCNKHGVAIDRTIVRSIDS